VSESVATPAQPRKRYGAATRAPHGRIASHDVPSPAKTYRALLIGDVGEAGSRRLRKTVVVSLVLHLCLLSVIMGAKFFKKTERPPLGGGSLAGHVAACGSEARAEG
jgi:hypothetical protein